jgi:small conductance mechanosensitive channel
MTAEGVLAGSVQWWQIVLGLLSVVVGWVLSRLAKRGILALAARARGISAATALLAARIVQYGIVLVGVGIGLAFVGANVQPLLAVVLVLAVVFALVLRGVAENFAAGVLIQTRQPVRLGDEIVVDAPGGAVTGTVTELNGRSVVLVTRDGRTIHVPNAKLISETVVNHSRHGGRRSSIAVRVERPPDIDPDGILREIAGIVATAPGVHTREPPDAIATAISPARVSAEVRFWHHPLHAVAVTAGTVVVLASALEERGWHVTVSSETAPPPLIPPDAV